MKWICLCFALLSCEASKPNIFVLEEVPGEQSCLINEGRQVCELGWKVRRFGVLDGRHQWLTNCSDPEEFSVDTIQTLEFDLLKYWYLENSSLSELWTVWSGDGSCVKREMPSIENQYDYFHEALIKLKLYNVARAMEHRTEEKLTFQKIRNASDKWDIVPVLGCETQASGVQQLSLLTLCFDHESEPVTCPVEWQSSCEDKRPIFISHANPQPSPTSTQEATPITESTTNSQADIVLLDITYDPLCSGCDPWNIDKLRLWSPARRKTKNCSWGQDFDVRSLYELLPTLALYWTSKAVSNDLKWKLDWEYYGRCIAKAKLITTPPDYFTLGILLFKLSQITNKTRFLRETTYYTKDHLKSVIGGPLAVSTVITCDIVNNEAYLYSVIWCFSSDLSPVACPQALQDNCFKPTILTYRRPAYNYSLAVALAVPTVIIVSILLSLLAYFVYSRIKRKKCKFISLSVIEQL